MFKTDTAYKHRVMTEVAFEVHSVIADAETRIYTVRVGWWTLKTFQHPMPMGISQILSIPFDSFEFYEEIDLDDYRKNPDLLNHGEIKL